MRKPGRRVRNGGSGGGPPQPSDDSEQFVRRVWTVAEAKRKVQTIQMRHSFKVALLFRMGPEPSAPHGTAVPPGPPVRGPAGRGRGVCSRRLAPPGPRCTTGSWNGCAGGVGRVGGVAVTSWQRSFSWRRAKTPGAGGRRCSGRPRPTVPQRFTLRAWLRGRAVHHRWANRRLLRREGPAAAPEEEEGDVFAGLRRTQFTISR